MEKEISKVRANAALCAIALRVVGCIGWKNFLRQKENELRDVRCGPRANARKRASAAASDLVDDPRVGEEVAQRGEEVLRGEPRVEGGHELRRVHSAQDAEEENARVGALCGGRPELAQCGPHEVLHVALAAPLPKLRRIFVVVRNGQDQPIMSAQDTAQ